MRDLIIALEARHPERAEVLEAISTIADTVDSLPLAPFFEPRSVILLDKGKGKRQLLSTTTDHIGAWAKHIAYACRFRMRTLEPTILREVCDGHLTASAILLR